MPATLAPPRTPRAVRARVDALPVARRAELGRVVRGVPATLARWNARVSPTWRWDWPHLAMLQRALDRVTAGEIRKLIVQMPPRHGKSETATVRYPIYRLTDNPETRVIIGAYNQTLAEKFSRKARRVALGSGLPLSGERTAVADWETTAGGGVRAVGVGGGATGQGADLLIIDDPVKSRAEAESLTYRETVWEWYTNDLFTRLEPGGAVVVIMTRWHGDDLAGRILASEDGPNWIVVNLPALAEANDPLGRAEGAALCPDRFDEAALDGIRTVMGEYGFAALYQQRPQPRGAGMFPREKVNILPVAPAGVRWLRWWDFGATAGGGDPTAGTKVGLHEGRVIIAHVASAHLASADRDRFIRQTAELDGTAVTQWGEQEPGSGGKAQAAAFVRLLAGWPVHTEPTTGDKATAMDPLAAQWQAGNVSLVAGPWNAAFLDEAEAAPFGAHEDAIEAASRAYIKLAGAAVVAPSTLDPRAWRHATAAA